MTDRPKKLDEMSPSGLENRLRETIKAQPQSHADAERFERDEERYRSELERRGFYVQDNGRIDWVRSGKTSQDVPNWSMRKNPIADLDKRSKRL